MPVTIGGDLPFCGRPISRGELALIQDTVHDFSALTLTELARTICELLGWRRANRKLKTIECIDFLRELQARGWLTGLPQAVSRATPKPSAAIPEPIAAEAPVSGPLAELLPLQWQLIDGPADRRLFRLYLDHHHYLGYRHPVGAQLRFFVRCPGRQGQVLACLLFTSAALKIAPRDQWIGWDSVARQSNLVRVVNHARFLILPWVRVPNLASRLLAEAARQVPAHWFAQYRVQPLLLETLVDARRFAGTCYRAANWTPVGLTQGRGRMDQRMERVGLAPKQIFLFPLCPEARERLCQPPQANTKN